MQADPAWATEEGKWVPRWRAAPPLHRLVSACIGHCGKARCRARAGAGGRVDPDHRPVAGKNLITAATSVSRA
jgi:hypothetical protein